MPNKRPTVTALDGTAVELAAASVFRITHSIPDDAGRTFTQVDYEDGLQETPETPNKVIADLAMAGVKMIQLTPPSGSPVYLSPDAITLVVASNPGDAPGAHTSITVAGHHQAVRETPAEVNAALGAGA